MILAGYRDHIDDLMAYNPGLASRFPNTWVFADYCEAELRRIFDFMIAERKLVTDATHPPIGRVLAARLGRGSGKPGFANARAVRNALDLGVKRQSERLAPRFLEEGRGAQPLTDAEAVTLTREDMLGAKPDLDNCPELDELRRMTGLDEVKDKVVELMHLQLANWDRESRGEKALEVPLHRIFYGKPGTGKTTVAGVFGRLLKRFGFLSNGEVVVKGPADFLGDVVGASEAKTVAILEACKGKVLLLDEVRRQPLPTRARPPARPRPGDAPDSLSPLPLATLLPPRTHNKSAPTSSFARYMR